jgi:hypothetical protein
MRLIQIYHPDLSSLEQQTRQLSNEQCRHCKQSRQLVSHGYVYKKRSKAQPAPFGKRVWCSNRNHRTGCGRTTQLYVSSIVRYLKYAGHCVVMFMLSRLAGFNIQNAYRRATGTADGRNAYRWVDKLMAQLSTYRSWFHQPVLPDTPPSAIDHSPLRWTLLCSTFRLLSLELAEPLCATYQLRWQRSLL